MPSTAYDPDASIAAGRLCLVTGGTSGIGRAVVEELAGLGARVFTCARSADDLDALLGECREQGWDVRGLPCDVSKPEERQRLMEAVAEAFGGRLNVLFNNVRMSMHVDQDGHAVPNVNWLHLPPLSARPHLFFLPGRHERAQAGCRLHRRECPSWVPGPPVPLLHLLPLHPARLTACTLAPLALVGLPQEDWQRLIAVNLESAFKLSQLAHPLLKASSDGVVIFNSRRASRVAGCGAG